MKKLMTALMILTSFSAFSAKEQIYDCVAKGNTTVESALFIAQTADFDGKGVILPYRLVLNFSNQPSQTLEPVDGQGSSAIIGGLVKEVLHNNNNSFVAQLNYSASQKIGNRFQTEVLLSDLTAQNQGNVDATQSFVLICK